MVGEGRNLTLTYVSGNTFTFTDTFASGLTVHVYEVNG